MIWFCLNNEDFTVNHSQCDHHWFDSVKSKRPWTQVVYTSEGSWRQWYRRIEKKALSCYSLSLFFLLCLFWIYAWYVYGWCSWVDISFYWLIPLCRVQNNCPWCNRKVWKYMYLLLGLHPEFHAYVHIVWVIVGTLRL